MNLRSQNNLDFLRFFASSLVLFSHSFPLTLAAKNEPISLATNGLLNGGKIAVIAFFILSGFLITASWEKRKDLKIFLLARIKRIFPGLLVALLLTTLVGATITTAPAYDYVRSAVVYFLKNITLYKGKFDIDGVFESNPYGPAINGSLWTLRHEFTCYLLIALFGTMGAIHKHFLWIVWLVVITLSSVAPTNSNFIREFLPLCAWFFAGALAYIHRDLRSSGLTVIGSLALIIATTTLGFNILIASPAIAYLLIQISYLRSPFSNFGKYGDFSYGIYIYAFPIQQLVIYLLVDSVSTPVNPWLVSLYSFPLTLLLSIASWNFVEKRFLHRKSDQG
jgi:peptidoglycan/LPS O-acetylase OafA/YrhL